MAAHAIKAIETEFMGWRFRSRTEARWAVFFDALDIRFEYEHEGYDFNGVRYLPDFWIPQSRTFFEVKGEDPSDEDTNKIALLAARKGAIVLVAIGAPNTEIENLLFVDRQLAESFLNKENKTPFYSDCYFFRSIRFMFSELVPRARPKDDAYLGIWNRHLKMGMPIGCGEKIAINENRSVYEAVRKAVGARFEFSERNQGC